MCRFNSKELSCSISFEKDKYWFFSLSHFYLFCKNSNRRLKFNDTGFLSFVSKKEVRHGYRRGGGHVFFAKYTLNLYTLNLSYILILKYPIFLYNFGQKWLDTLYGWKIAHLAINNNHSPTTALTVLYLLQWCKKEGEEVIIH